MSNKPGLDLKPLLAAAQKNKKQEMNRELFLKKKISKDVVSNKLVKIAFDVYHIDNDPYESLWRLESFADGTEYLVRMDEIPENIKTASANWSADSNESGTSVTLFYKNQPIQRLSGKIFNFDSSDVSIFKKALLEKVNSDENFRKKLVNMQPSEKKKELLALFPELG